MSLLQFKRSTIIGACLVVGEFFGSVIASDLLGLVRFEGLAPLARSGIILLTSAVIGLILYGIAELIRATAQQRHYQDRVVRNIEDAKTRWPHA